jgi:hypothetical protein
VINSGLPQRPRFLPGTPLIFLAMISAHNVSAGITCSHPNAVSNFAATLAAHDGRTSDHPADMLIDAHGACLGTASSEDANRRVNSSVRTGDRWLRAFSPPYDTHLDSNFVEDRAARIESRGLRLPYRVSGDSSIQVGLLGFDGPLDDRRANPPLPSPVPPDPDPSRSIVSTDGTGAENIPAAGEITPQLEDAVRKGFEYLRRNQKTDGSFGQGRFGQHVGVTSLCAIAFMADGNVPGRGTHAEAVQKALRFVLSHSTETGLLVSDQTHGPMYGHGFATLFLGEIYGMNQDDDRVRDALVRAVQLIIGSQNDEGGWRYNPVPDDADVSVTICQVMALRSARNAGIKVPKTTIDDAIRYVRACQNADGGFRYMKDLGGSAWPRTAAGVASLFYAGVYEGPSIDRALDYLDKNAFPRGGGGFAGGFSQPHYFYGHYYAVQAMYLSGGDRWKTWWPAIRDELLAKQNADGSWTDPQGDAYGTSMALIILQMPKRYLPIFQR